MLNRVVLMGRLTADPELKKTPGGVSVTAFLLAVQRSYQKEEADFINIVAWRQTAEFICRYFKKGQLIALEGRIQTRGYTDKNGNKRTAFEVITEQVYFAGGTSQGGEIGISKGSSFELGSFGEYEEIDTEEGDLPF